MEQASVNADRILLKASITLDLKGMMKGSTNKEGIWNPWREIQMKSAIPTIQSISQAQKDPKFTKVNSNKVTENER